MPVEGVRIKEIFDRVRRLKTADQSWEEFYEECGITRWTFKIWENKAEQNDKEFVPALSSLARIAQKRGVSLDELVYGPGRASTSTAYVVLQQAADEIRGTLDRAMASIPAPRDMDLVKREPPADEDPE